MNEPFEVEPPTPDDDRALARVYEAVRRKAEQWYIDTRRDLAHARLALDVVVLRPICDDCDNRLGRASCLTRGGEPEITILLPEEVIPERIRLYDSRAHAVHLFPPTEPYREHHDVLCSICRQRVSSAAGNDIISVYEESLEVHFGFVGQEDEGPKRKRGRRERNRIREMYGSHCFECGASLGPENFTLDHIVAQSRGGPTISINLQPLCHACNQRKANIPVTNVKIALDMLLRPAPWETYEDPIW